jgi:hypothetical protein
MSKFFYRLLHKFRVMGCEIIYASYQKIVVDTKKHDIETAVGFIQKW